MDKQKRLDQIKKKLNMHGDIRVKVLKEAYYTLLYSMDFPDVELNELKIKLSNRELDYTGFEIEAHKLLMQYPQYRELKELEMRILEIEPDFLYHVNAIPTEQKIKVLTFEVDILKDRIIG